MSSTLNPKGDANTIYPNPQSTAKVMPAGNATVYVTVENQGGKLMNSLLYMEIWK